MTEWTRNGDRSIPKPFRQPEPEQEGEIAPFPATPITLAEWDNIPPRERVYGHFLFRKFISAIGAPGGAGKTAYAFAIAFAVAVGRDQY